MTIIEVRNSKLEDLIKCTEKIIKHSTKLLECLKAMDEPVENKYMETYTYNKTDKKCEEYSRYN